MIRRFASTLRESVNARSAWEKSCYHKIDFTIKDSATVYEAIQKFTAYDIGCLAVKNKDNKVIGVVTERDYVHKVALLDKPKTTLVSEICTFEPNVRTSSVDDSIYHCMNKILDNNVRHLLIVDNNEKNVVGLLSIKDLVKEVVSQKDSLIRNLANLRTGEGSFYEK